MTHHRTLQPVLVSEPSRLAERFSALRTRQDVADLLEVSDRDLIYILYRGQHHYPYRVFHIPKKGGGTREIDAPHNSLKILQSKLNAVLRNVYKPGSAVHGYVSGRSIRTNATHHAAKRFVLNADLKDFFPSINFGRVRGLFGAKPYQVSPEAATVLARICCYQNQLPQGAPTSPTVSNMVCARLDAELRHLARQHHCAYTRYADDLSFSTNEPEFPAALASREDGWGPEHVVLGEPLVMAIRSNGFEPNMQKSRLQYQNLHQEVTGLVVNQFPNVKRRFIRQLRAMIHAWQKYGLEQAEREFLERYDSRARNPDLAPPSYARVVRGKLDFLKMIRGEDNALYIKFANKLHDLDDELVRHHPEPPAEREQRWDYWKSYYEELVFQLVIKHHGDEKGGTAFSWRKSLLATTAHDLDGQISISPPCPPGVIFKPEDFLRHPSGDAAIDVAVAALPEGCERLRRAFPVRTEPLLVNEPVAALGYPNVPQHAPGLVIYSGVVESALPYYRGGVEAIQVTIRISGGMSGAPVIDIDGNLVGIVRGQPFDEQAAEGVPSRDFKDIVPVRYLIEIQQQVS